MRITIESTTQLVEVNGVPARVWEGQTDSGIPVTVLVTRIAIPEGQEPREFNEELQHCRPPVIVAVWPTRMML